MAITSCLGCSTECILLVLVVTGLSILSPAWSQSCTTEKGELQINISSIPPSNKLSIGAAINLTCTAWQTNDLANNPYKGPEKIEWLDPQNNRIGPKCQQEETPPAMSVMNCSLKVDALTDGKLANYTCKACNSYKCCSTKRFQVDRQQDTRHLEFVNVPVNQTALLGSNVTFNCTATGYPKLTITWERVNNDSGSVQYNLPAKILAGDGNSIFSQLVIKEVKSKDYGIYHCVAKNSVGEKISIAILGSTGPSTTNKKKNVEIVAIFVAFSVAVMFLGAVSVFLQFFRRRCPRNQVV